MRRGLSPLSEFALLARVPEEALDLEQLALSIGRIGTPELDPTSVSARLDRMAASVADTIDPNAPPDRLAVLLAQAFGRTLGFRGTPAAYQSAEGSFLHHVVDHRTGLPILLGVAWIVLGRRVGVTLSGVNYPGHFLVCLDAPGARIYLDPFHGGALSDVQDLVDRLPDGSDRRALEPVSVRPIVVRMLTNLKHLWTDRGDLLLALGAVDRILVLAGEVPHELRDRGLLATHLGRSAEARRDLKRYLEIAPKAPDRDAIARILARSGDT